MQVEETHEAKGSGAPTRDDSSQAMERPRGPFCLFFLSCFRFFPLMVHTRRVCTSRVRKKEEERRKSIHRHSYPFNIQTSRSKQKKKEALSLIRLIHPQRELQILKLPSLSLSSWWEAETPRNETTQTSPQLLSCLLGREG